MQHALLVVSIIWLAVLSPGADFAMVSRNSCLYGRAAGLSASAGIALACWFHVIYAIFGIAIVQKFSPNILSLVKGLGAVYLVYAGLTTAFGKPVAYDDDLNVGTKTIGAGLAHGLLTNGLNPKTSIFVISLYSQIIGRNTPVLLQLSWGLFISMSHLLWFSTVSALLSQKSARELVLRNQRKFNRAIGVVLTALGVVLFTMAPIGGHA